MRDLRDGETLVGQFTVRVARDREGDFLYSFATSRVNERDRVVLAAGLLDVLLSIVGQHPDLPFHAAHICASEELRDAALRLASEDAREAYVQAHERAPDDVTTFCSLCQLRYSDQAERVT